MQYTIGDVIANIKSTLESSGQERYFDKDFNLNSHINASLKIWKTLIYQFLNNFL